MDGSDDGAHRQAHASLSRRELLGRGAAIGVVLALPTAAGTATVGRISTAAAAPTTLTSAQQAILRAAVDRLIPADANGPSGTQAGVAAYITQGLTGGLAGGLSKTAPLYKAGLPAIDAYAQSAYGGAFTALAPAQQDAVLSDIEAGKPKTGFVPDAATFFSALREHALQGMFSDPVYGGNKNFAGWDLIGYAGVRMPLPASDQKIGVNVKKAHASTYAHGQYPKAKKEAVA